MELLRKKIQEYKELKEKEGVTIYDYRTHPDNIEKMWQMSINYSKDDWLSFSEVFEQGDDFIRIFSENRIDSKKFTSEIIFTINRYDSDPECIYRGYKRIKDFIDFLGTDYIALWDNMQSVIELETGKTINVLS